MTALRYLAKDSIRTLHFLQSKSTYKNVKILLRNESSFAPKRVLVLSKISRYHFERLREPNLDKEALKRKLIRRGSDYDALIAGHYSNKETQERTIDTLRKLNIEYKIMDRLTIIPSHVEWADLILPVGGDGTFLLAANLIHDNAKPIIGINSDPASSEGFLMLPLKYSSNIPKIFELLQNGEYKCLIRKRIRVILKGEGIWSTPFHMHEKGRVPGVNRFYVKDAKVGANIELPDERRLPWLALNEVFIGESLSARTSSLLLKVNEEEKYHKVISSGLCISTGTGSTSWHRAINFVTPKTVQDILYIANNGTKEYSNEELERICAEYNNNIKFDAEDPKMCYSIRDMILKVSHHDWPVPKKVQPHAFCDSLEVQSQCYDAGLVIDGGIAVPFNIGTTAILKTYSEDSLRTISLPE